MKRNRNIMVILVLAFLGLAVFARAQQPITCPSKYVDPKAPEYKIGLAGHASKKGCELYLYISLDPSQFVREDMVALARRLNKDFCYEKQLTAIILDDYRAANHPLRNSKAYWNAERGVYHLDRASHQEYIKFSTARGKPQDEIVVDLSAEIK